MAKKMIWIAHARYAEDAAVNLLCFSYAGGSAAYFSPLKAEIDSRINLCPVLYPGRERNAGIPNFDTLEACAKAFVTENPQLFTDYEIVKGKMDDVFLAVTGRKLTGGEDK